MVARSTPVRAMAPELPHSILLNPEHGIVLLTQPRRYRPQLSTGCAWQVAPRNCSVIDEQDCLRIAGIHENLLRLLPVGASFQSLMTLVPSTTLSAWEQARAGHCNHPVVQAQLASIRAGLPHHEGTTPARLRLVDTTMTVRLPFTQQAPTLGAWARTLLMAPGRSGPHLAALLRRSQAADLDRFEGIRCSLESTMQSVGHRINRMNGEELAQSIAHGLRPSRRGHPVFYEEVPLSEQVLDGAMRTTAGGFQYGSPEPGGGFLETERSQLLTLHQAPPQVYPGILSAPRAPLGHTPLALWHAWPGPLTVVVNVAIVDRAQEAARMRWKRMVAGLHSKKSVENTMVVDQIDTLLQNMMAGEGDMLWCRVHIVLWGDPQTLPQGLNRVIEQGKGLKLSFGADAALASTLQLQALPLGFDWHWPDKRWLACERHIPITIIAQLLTFYGGGHGTTTPAIPYLNDLGEVVYWSPFDSATNPHSARSGTSGAGKTYSTAREINHLMALGVTVVIVDPLTNFRHLCASWEGQLHSVGFTRPPCHNPFYGDLSPGHVSFIGAFLKQCASGGGEHITWEEFSVLSSALSYFATMWDRTRGEPTLTLFVEEVLQTGIFDDADADAGRIGRQIARKLKLFYGRVPNRGQYADFVDGANTFTLQPGLNVIELGELENHPALKGILFFAMVHLMYQFLKDPTRYYHDKFIFFDEVWSFADLPETAHQVDRMIRTGRNHGISVHFLSQLVSDWDTPMGKVIRALVGTTMFLQHEGDELVKIKALFNLSDVETEVLRRAQKHADCTTAYLRFGDKRGGLVRIVGDAYTHAQMSQDRGFAQRRDRAIAAAGGDVRAGLAALVAEEVAHSH